MLEDELRHVSAKADEIRSGELSKFKKVWSDEFGYVPSDIRQGSTAHEFIVYGERMTAYMDKIMVSGRVVDVIYLESLIKAHMKKPNHGGTSCNAD